MTLYFDSLIIDRPLYKKFVDPNDEIRGACRNYAMPVKIDIAKYTLASYATYDWSHVLIRYELGDPNGPRSFEAEYGDFDNFILKLFPKAILMHERSDSQDDFRKSIEILDKFDDDWIFYAGNNDHPIMASKIPSFDQLIDIADGYKDKYKFISIIYSHFSEFLNLPKKYTPFNSAYGGDAKIIAQNKLATVIVRQNGDFSAIQIVNKNLLKNWFDSVDLGNKTIWRSEDVREKVSTQDQLMIIPKQEICGHFDGYAHTIGSKTQILPDQVPPLFIPPGFFENKIKIRYGYNDYREGWVNINPAAVNYSFRDNKHGSDLMWTLDDIPLFWKNHIAKIDSNPDRDDNYLKKMRDKKYEKVKNPWKDSRFQQIRYIAQDISSLPRRAIKKIYRAYFK